VTWSEATLGSSLVAETDLNLIDRPIAIGFLVKRHLKDTLSGTVISTSLKYVLQPVAYRDTDHRTGERGPIKFAQRPPRSSFVGEQYRNDTDGPALISDVAAEDLTDYDEFREGNYIIHRQKVGLIQQVDRDAILMLSNQTAVSPLNPSILEYPVSAGSRPIVSLPANSSSDSLRPASSDSHLWIPNDNVFPGQFVRTTQKNLRRGAWISGCSSPNHPAEGYILATPAIDVHVDWLCSNIFSVGLPFFGPTSEVIRASTLLGQATIYDYGKLPRGTAESNRFKQHGFLPVGERVRFRDPAGAAVKYPSFDRISKEQTFDLDLNVLKIVSMKSEAVVQWQDLSITTEPATSLHSFSGIENEVWPGEVVVLKDEIQTAPNPNRNAFEPLAYTFHPIRNHSILQTRKVGVVQTVNSRERVAMVRWYKNPQVEFLHEGHVLKPSSVLGELGEEVSEVSMYEVTTKNGLVRSRGEMVLLVPEKVHHTHLLQDARSPSSTAAGPCHLSYLFPITFTQTNVYLEHIKKVLVNSDWFKHTIEIDSTALPPRHSIRREEFSLNHPLDWIGQIVSRDIDGTITVRLGALQNCRDIRVPMERILMVLDNDLAGGSTGEMDGMGEFYDELEGYSEFHDQDLFDRMATPFALTIEYEGAVPDDGLSDSDEMWATEHSEDNDEDHEDADYDEDIVAESSLTAPELIEIAHDSGDKQEEVDMKDGRPEPNPQRAPNNKDAAHTALDGIHINACPPSFSILDTEPPIDHHFRTTPVLPAVPQRLRRIQKEYQILGSSLPQGIFARTWESRMDLMRVLIIGPQGTPYEFAPYIIDFRFNSDFPTRAPETFFHSWTNGMGRINPNMYEDGKICLSILGTWPPKNPAENWSPAKSTVLQILVSIMGLVLVKDPFYSM
jgi:ubiquitin-conjugating enzyme E2 O